MIRSAAVISYGDFGAPGAADIGVWSGLGRAFFLGKFVF